MKVRFGPPVTPHLICTFACVETTEWDGSHLRVSARLPEWSDHSPPGSHYYLAVAHRAWTLAGVDGGETRRAIPDFDAVRVMPMAGSDGVATLVPRDFNHPPIEGYKACKAHVVAFEPPMDVILRFRQ